MDDKTQVELEAAAFRTLVSHLRERTDVQNIDLMNLAGFCRNCLSKWYRAAAEEKGLDMDLEQARQQVYGMTRNDIRGMEGALPDRGIARAEAQVRRGGHEARLLTRFSHIPQAPGARSARSCAPRAWTRDAVAPSGPSARPLS